MMRFVITLRAEDLVMREKEVSGNRGKEGGEEGGGRDVGGWCTSPEFRASERYILKQSPVRCALLIYNATGCCLS